RGGRQVARLCRNAEPRLDRSVNAAKAAACTGKLPVNAGAFERVDGPAARDARRLKGNEWNGPLLAPLKIAAGNPDEILRPDQFTTFVSVATLREQQIECSALQHLVERLCQAHREL